MLFSTADFPNGALSNDLKDVVMKHFPGTSSRTPIAARFARPFMCFSPPPNKFRSDGPDDPPLTTYSMLSTEIKTFQSARFATYVSDSVKLISVV